jgi:hypothetical protein
LRAAPFWAGALAFAVVLGVLLYRNAYLFATPLHEDADMGADSILIEQARRWTLLVGNYSRERFHHPGPAFLYVQSWGESLFWSALHVVPTAWNGQLIALYALNALLTATVVAVGCGWARTLRGALGVFAVAVFFAALHPVILSSDWMPYVYVPAYFAFLVAIASVAAGRLADLWIAALAGWFCVHGHACFLFFVPVLTGCAVLALAWPRRRRLPAAMRYCASHYRRSWVAGLVISLLFALPMAAELALHWPGNFGAYFGYGSSAAAGGHSAASVARYLLWFWWPHAHAAAVALAVSAAACAATWWCPAGPVRRFCAFLLLFDALSTAAFAAYAALGIDALNQYYIGYFYWSVPIVAVLVTVLALVERAPSRAALAAVTLAGCAAVAVLAAAPQTRTSTNHTDPDNLATGANTDPALPAAVRRLAAAADGRPIVLRLQHNAWPDMTGFLIQAERTGVTACLANPSWEFMVTRQFICTPSQRARGKPYWLRVTGTDLHGRPVVTRLRRAIVTAGAQET